MLKKHAEEINPSWSIWKETGHLPSLRFLHSIPTPPFSKFLASTLNCDKVRRAKPPQWYGTELVSGLALCKGQLSNQMFSLSGTPSPCHYLCHRSGQALSPRSSPSPCCCPSRPPKRDCIVAVFPGRALSTDYEARVLLAPERHESELLGSTYGPTFFNKNFSRCATLWKHLQMNLIP